ncbi:FMN phosphatase YigB (HAD superfamily) [Streptacidiphilus sp. BW17]
MRFMPPLLLFDLDNTLVDRNQAFRGWARRFLDSWALPGEDLYWLSTLDCGGYFPREALMRATAARYGLRVSLELLLRDYADTMTELIQLPETHREALHQARAAGWTLGIVSNGATEQQLAKIERTGLARLVDGWVISEEAACEKPDPRIFHLAAERCGLRPQHDDASSWTSSTWMVGDHAPADIAGAQVAGLRSVWLHHGRPWPELGYHPTLTAKGLPEAVTGVLSAPRYAPAA